MASDPITAGRKGGQSRSAAKLAAARKNGFQRRYGADLPVKAEPLLPAKTTADAPTTAQEQVSSK